MKVTLILSLIMMAALSYAMGGGMLRYIIDAALRGAKKRKVRI